MWVNIVHSISADYAVQMTIIGNQDPIIFLVWMSFFHQFVGGAGALRHKALVFLTWNSHPKTRRNNNESANSKFVVMQVNSLRCVLANACMLLCSLVSQTGCNEFTFDDASLGQGSLLRSDSKRCAR